MPAFITLASFTDQGARNIKDSPARFQAFKAAAEAAGVAVRSVHWTTGACDLVLVLEGPEEAVMTVALKTAALGNVRTNTLRGFTLDEMKKLVAAMG
ncbi:MAG TPA: GYD domain-containing protein [Rubrivivax sp.]|nr:GYD domain-containing protein [Rubrivivax sp.]